MTNEITLVPILQEMELAPEQSKTLLDSFGDLFVEAHKLVAQSKGINVVREDQVAEMAEAKAIRIRLMKIRTQAEKTKKMIKEPYLRGAQAAQDIYNDIKSITEPEEERLYDQEKFAELAEQARVEKRLSDRTTALARYVDDVSVYSLRDMPDDVFGRLVDDCRMVYEAKVEKARKEEEERIENAKAEAKRQKEIEAENARLKQEAEDRAKVEKVRQEEADAKIRRAQEGKERAERALKDQKEKEQKRLDEIARKEKEEEEKKMLEERERLLAPDKKKLMMLADDLEKYAMPALSSQEAQDISWEAEVMIQRTVEYIREKSRGL